MPQSRFDLTGRVALVTGGYGVLGGSIAEGLAAAGAKVALLGRRRDAAEERAEVLRKSGAAAMAVVADVLSEDALRSARREVVGAWGKIDILINAAGGNVGRARTDDIPVFEMSPDAFDEVLRLNLHGTVLPTLIFGEQMAEEGVGSIVNISSMASIQAISGVPGYSVAKAGIDNFTKWMAVDLARRSSPRIRVNAVAPGFFISAQNHDVLINPDGSLTERSERIIDQTPAGRFGKPEELQGTVVWLCSDEASFVTGVVIPVDGGFSAYSGI